MKNIVIEIRNTFDKLINTSGTTEGKMVNLKIWHRNFLNRKAERKRVNKQNKIPKNCENDKRYNISAMGTLRGEERKE